MKVLRFTALIVLSTVLIFAGSTASQAATVVDFESFGLPPAQDGSPGGYLNGSDGAGGFIVDGVFFNNNYNKDWGSWSGFSISNHTDTTTAGFTNQYSAYPAPVGGDASSQYAVACWSAYAPPPSVFINFPTDSIALSVDLTNTTYAALSMKNGDNFAKKFGGVKGEKDSDGNDPDYFHATFTGYSGLNGTGPATGSLDFYLADFRDLDPKGDYVLDAWTNLDLKSLGNKLRSISIEFASSDIGEYGMNTPAYLAMDNLIISAVPEPSSLALLGFVTSVAVMVRRRKSIA